MKRFAHFPIAALCAAVLLLGACATPAGPAATNTPASASATLPPPATETVAPPTQPPASATPTPPTATSEPSGPKGIEAVISASNADQLQPLNEVKDLGAMQAAFSAAPEVIALAGENGVTIHTFNARGDTIDLPADQPNHLTTAADASLIAYTTQENTIHLFDVEAASEVGAIPQAAPVSGLALSPDGRLIASSTISNTLGLYPATDGVPPVEVELPYWLNNLAFSPDGTQIAGSDSMDFTVHFYDAQTLADLRSLSWTDHASPVLYGVYFSPDWKTLAWVARGTVQLMDVESGALGQSLQHEDFISASAWSPDGKLFATAAGGTYHGEFSPLVTLWNVDSGEAAAILPQKTTASSLSFSPDGKILAVLSSDGELTTWAVAP